jgi:hypothetical protein
MPHFATSRTDIVGAVRASRSDHLVDLQALNALTLADLQLLADLRNSGLIPIHHDPLHRHSDSHRTVVGAQGPQEGSEAQ